jgi:predicted nucleic acid-binding protein
MAQNRILCRGIEKWAICYTQNTMKIYLDNCAINRPFDDQSQERIRLETEAVLLILTRLTRRDWTWLGSQALEIEIKRTPDAEQQARLQRVVDFIQLSVEIGLNELARAGELERLGFVGFDAVHIACAESGQANVFLTTDDRLLKLAKRHSKKLHVQVANPLDWIKEIF